MTAYALGKHTPERSASGETYIAPDAAVIGTVSLGPRSSVWFGAVLRGDNEPIRVGSGSNIQDLCVVHTDPGYPATIGNGCTIGHRAIIHGCTVGDNTLIGMGAIVLNGAIIGRNCIVGAGALIAENKTIPDGSLVVGMPGKIIRSVSDADIAGLQAAAQNYIERAARYLRELRPIEDS